MAHREWFWEHIMAVVPVRMEAVLHLDMGGRAEVVPLAAMVMVMVPVEAVHNNHRAAPRYKVATDLRVV
ncbi:hypothetical protein [Sodalis sp. dw_96]|uniref:hypothetical protein n=1 Tax=Sodalis sp. dw_96 TaxID=2719794 RepID=UPI001BD3C243|nr:hypothetical protein [Sodalis sp. dw_96]